MIRRTGVLAVLAVLAALALLYVLRAGIHGPELSPKSVGIEKATNLPC